MAENNKSDLAQMILSGAFDTAYRQPVITFHESSEVIDLSRVHIITQRLTSDAIKGEIDHIADMLENDYNWAKMGMVSPEPRRGSKKEISLTAATVLTTEIRGDSTKNNGFLNAGSVALLIRNYEDRGFNVIPGNLLVDTVPARLNTLRIISNHPNYADHEYILKLGPESSTQRQWIVDQLHNGDNEMLSDDIVLERVVVQDRADYHLKSNYTDGDLPDIIAEFEDIQAVLHGTIESVFSE